MTFNSLQFASFFAVVLLIYWQVGHRKQNLLLSATSYLFYGVFDPRFLGLLWLSTCTDFLVGRQLGKFEHDDRRRRRVFSASIITNLGILGTFKYFNFFLASGQSLLQDLGMNISPVLLRIALPVGISFYTFHGISYTFDVYRRHLKPATDFVSFAVFVAYFPQLVAGPIGRADSQLHQFENPRTKPSQPDRRSGAVLILQGLFKKVVVADLLAPIANDAFSNVAARSSIALLLGIYAFALQIYGDFSGYSDIARGCSRLLGVELIENFRQPYLSTSITDFWRRWHISLSNWLRDYLYVSLGGNRNGRAKTYRNLALTMLIGGLWHGASWTFVIWGGLHGLYLVSERLWKDGRKQGARAEQSSRSPNRIGIFLRWAVTINLVCLAWVFFRASSFREAVQVFTGIFELRRGLPEPQKILLFLVLGGLCLLLDFSQLRHQDDESILRFTARRRGAIYGVLVALIVIASGSSPVPFLYFQF